MTKTVLHFQPMSRPLGHPLSRPLAITALLVILALSVGGALAERVEQRASEDRLSFGEVAEQG